MLFNTHTLVYINPSKKLVLLTTLRTGSSWCDRHLTEEQGWEVPKDTLSGMGLEKIQSLHEQKFQFFCAIKEPYLRLSSAMEIVVPPLRFEENNSLDPMINQEIFANAMSLIVYKNATVDLNDYGVLNYNCGDSHMSWGTHVSAMFLESLGIPCKPLILESNNLLAHLKPRENENTFSGFIENLGYRSQDTGVNYDKTNLRANRFAAWIQICSGHTNPNIHGIQHLTPSYTVFDWLNNDKLLYNSCLDMDSYAPEARQKEAQKRVLMVINDMWLKLNIEGIFKGLPYREKNNTIYPWDTMFDLMRLFMHRQSDLPEFYDREHCNNLFKLPDHHQFVVQKMENSE